VSRPGDRVAEFGALDAAIEAGRRAGEAALAADGEALREALV